ncbi:hypothetical protein MRX96_048677 [Rhipicephalus microplus]
MRILWHLYLFIGLVVAAGAEPINNVPGCEDAPTPSKATPSIGTTETETTTRTTTTTKGAREKYEPKYGYYKDYYGCIYTVLTSHKLLYHALCTYTCPWYPYVYRVRNGVTCLTEYAPWKLDG